MITVKSLFKQLPIAFLLVLSGCNDFATPSIAPKPPVAVLNSKSSEEAFDKSWKTMRELLSDKDKKLLDSAIMKYHLGSTSEAGTPKGMRTLWHVSLQELNGLTAQEIIEKDRLVQK